MNPSSILLLCLSAGLALPGAARAQAETPAGTPYSPFPKTVLATKVKHFDNQCWKVAAGGGTWYFENGETGGKTGFSSAFDQVGNDWIGNDADKGYNTSPKGSGKHEYRGFPNLGNGDFDHPQRASGSKTRWVDKDGKEVPFVEKLEGEHLILRSSNAKYEVEYHFFRSHIAVKVLRADDKYAFLYEGPIGGEQEAATVDKWYGKDGVANRKWCSTTGCSSPFLYFVDPAPKDNQVLFLGVNPSPGMGGDSYVAADNMVVVSYGRFGNYPNDKRALTGLDNHCVIGFLPKGSHEATTAAIEGILKSPFAPAGTVSATRKPSVVAEASRGSILGDRVLHVRRGPGGALDLFGSDGRRIPTVR